MSKFNQLRKEYPSFIYHGYEKEINGDVFAVKYHFEIAGLAHFFPEWKFKIYRRVDDIDDNLIENLVFSLGMVELVSYWKATCSPDVLIVPHGLSSEMVKWWKKLYFGGLGEFFYTNAIDTSVDTFMNITCTNEKIIKSQPCSSLSGALVPVGGGKDSAVTLKILDVIKEEIMPYIINGREATTLTCDVAGYSNNRISLVKRTIDKNLIDLNTRGFLNGHTPFSAIVAFSSVLSAVFCSKKYVILSNESSANESTIKGESINHQFSKGEDFENDFIEYEKKYITSGVSYFSFLRPLSEMQISMLFAKYREFHSVFKSCNVGSKKDIWCCNCPKCLFVYIILSPFLSKKELINIFGEELLDKKSLSDVFKQLSGIYENKPFECVGSRDEVVVACDLTIKKYKANGEKIPYLLELFSKYLLISDNNIDYYINYFDKRHHLPQYFENILLNELKEQIGYVSEN